MRRLVILLTTLLVVAFGHGAAIAAPAASVQYATGWNLVAGPDGSHLLGSAGPLYTLQPGDSSYETLPAGSALKGGVGYWAYFPSGGSLNAQTGSLSYSVATVPNQWIMVGNPSGVQALNFANIDVAYTYGAASGYTSVFSLNAGQGAFVLAQRQVTLGVIPPTVPPPAAPAAAPGSIAQTFSGALTIDNQPAPGGTTVTARSNGSVCGSATVGASGRYSLTLAPTGGACAAAGANLQLSLTPKFGSEWQLAAPATYQPGVNTQRDIALDLRQLAPSADNVPLTGGTWSQTTGIPIAICDTLSPAATTAANTAFGWWRDATRSQGLGYSLYTDANRACSDTQPGIALFSDTLKDPKAIAATGYLDSSLNPCNVNRPCAIFKAVIVVNYAVFNHLDSQTQARAIAHEIGHALGLGHSVECDGGTLMWKDDRCAFPVDHVGVDDIASLNRRLGINGGAADLNADAGATYTAAAGPDEPLAQGNPGAFPLPDQLDPFDDA